MNRHNPFKTPEGYFDDFNKRFMAKLPEQKPQAGKVSMSVMIRRIVAAACFIIMCCGGFVWWNAKGGHADKDNADNKALVSAHDQYVDDYVDCAMMDNSDIIACISE
ncbi:MAG: hypothetical protein SOZ58_11685 [Prevotella sp.]|nr:hypothetical protein [Prevotella sp.]